MPCFGADTILHNVREQCGQVLSDDCRLFGKPTSNGSVVSDTERHVLSYSCELDEVVGQDDSLGRS